MATPRTAIIKRERKDFLFRTRASDCYYCLYPVRGNDEIFGFCPDDFHKFTELRLKPGQEARVRINVEVLEHEQDD